MMGMSYNNAGRPDHDQQYCYYHAPTVKPEAAAAVVVAPDDGHENARNTLSCIETTNNKLEKLIHLVA
jgi:hypothetical protein